jgi:hypothetical protein
MYTDVPSGVHEVLDNKTITQAMSGVDSSMEWKEKKKHLEAAGITPRNIPPVCIYVNVFFFCTKVIFLD